MSSNVSKILNKHSNDLVKIKRHDSEGKEINIKGQHKLIYRDQLDKGKSCSLADTYEVESYKAYNASEVEDEGMVCHCSVFWNISKCA
jgi:protein tyrosine phosphatase